MDVQAQINLEPAAQQSEFGRQLQEATGHGDIKVLVEANLKARGKLQELADSKAQEASGYKARFEQSAIGNALLAASSEAIDPATVGALLADKPFLANAQGGTGSGAPQQAGGGVKNPWSKAHFNLTEQYRIAAENPALAAQLQAANQP